MGNSVGSPKATDVEMIGFEPTTPCLQSRCSAKLSYIPVGPHMIRRCERDARRDIATGRLRRRESSYDVEHIRAKESP